MVHTTRNSAKHNTKSVPDEQIQDLHSTPVSSAVSSTSSSSSSSSHSKAMSISPLKRVPQHPHNDSDSESSGIDMSSTPKKKKTCRSKKETSPPPPIDIETSEDEEDGLDEEFEAQAVTVLSQTGSQIPLGIDVRIFTSAHYNPVGGATIHVDVSPEGHVALHQRTKSIFPSISKVISQHQARDRMQVVR